MNWLHVLDWMMFSRKHKGEITQDELDQRDMRMLEDIWAPLDVHESVRGFKGKLALAGNIWRAWWKYRQFTDMSWLKALRIQAKGFLLEKEVRL